MSNIEYTPFLWGGVELSTLGEMMDVVVSITLDGDAEEARRFMEEYRTHNKYADENMGYLIGHLTPNVGAKALTLFRKADKGDYQFLSEDWLLDNLPEGWTYRCSFTPEPAFHIYASEGGAAPEYGPLIIPLRLLAKPELSQILGSGNAS